MELGENSTGLKSDVLFNSNEKSRVLSMLRASVFASGGLLGAILEPLPRNVENEPLEESRARAPECSKGTPGGLPGVILEPERRNDQNDHLEASWERF